MGDCLSIKNLYDHVATQLSSSFEFPECQKFKTYLCSHPLVGRVTSNWKVILMDVSTIIAISCCALTLLNGSAFFSVFAVLAISSGVGSFYMRRIAALSSLATTAKELQETKEQLELFTNQLQTTNSHLAQTNQDLQLTNLSLHNTNRGLETTNQALRQTNDQLETQVTQLTLHVTQLSESAQRIRTEMVRFQEENASLHQNVHGLDQSLHLLDDQILSSKGLCEQITHHLATQQEGLAGQLNQLKEYLSSLSAENRVHQKIQELGTLQEQMQQATSQLHNIQLQYAAERANFQAIHEALLQLKQQFDTAIQGVTSDMRSQNEQWRNNLSTNQQQFQQHLAALASERERIQQMLNRYNTPFVSTSSQHSQRPSVVL